MAPLKLLSDPSHSVMRSSRTRQHVELDQLKLSDRHIPLRQRRQGPDSDVELDHLSQCYMHSTSSAPSWTQQHVELDHLSYCQDTSHSASAVKDPTACGIGPLKPLTDTSHSVSAVMDPTACGIGPLKRLPRRSPLRQRRHGPNNMWNWTT